MMIPEHLKAYEIGLVAWTFLMALFGIQGLITVFLEGKELEPHEGEERGGSPWAVLLFAGLFLVDVAFSLLFMRGLFGGARAETLALYSGVIFLALAAMLIVYRRFFVKDEVIAQEREDDFPW
ncbi:MAG: hypothetical protein ACE5LQ_00320 [Candidatus Bipolaricaulia bacterium]